MSLSSQHAGSRPDELEAQRLWSQQYEEIRAMAASVMRRERAGHTLQATALANETYLRMRDALDTSEDASLARSKVSLVMKRVLIDHARAKGASKRTPPPGHVADSQVGDQAVGDEPGGVAASMIGAALARLEGLSAMQSDIAALILLGGLTQEQVAAALGTSLSTVKRNWRSARAFLRYELERGMSADDA